MVTRQLLTALVAGALVSPALAQSVMFNFDNVPAHTPLPIDVTVDGITAHLSYQFYGYSIQRADTYYKPNGFDGNCVFPNTVFRDDLYVSFSQPLSEFSLIYSPHELACSSSARMKVTAYLDNTLVGSSTTTAPGPGTWPTGQLVFNSASPFNRVVIHYDAPPPTGGDFGVIFLSDYMAVSPFGGATTETLAPTSQTLNLGLLDGGDVSSLAAQDGDFETICKFFVPNMTSPFVRLTLNYVSTKTTPTRVEFFTTARMANAGLYKVRLLLWNYGFGAYEEVLSPARIGDEFQYGIGRPTGDPLDSIGPNGEMRGRIEFLSAGPGTTQRPCVDIDLAVMKVSG